MDTRKLAIFITKIKRFTYLSLRSIFMFSILRQKQMPKKQKRSVIGYFRTTPVLFALSAGVVTLAVAFSPFLSADQYQDQINSLQSQNNAAEAIVSGLQSQATSYQDAINVLNSQITALQQAIATNDAKQQQIQQQIVQTQQEITSDKQTLADDVKTMYINGSITPIEELATSKNLSDYVDQQVAYNAVQDDLNTLIAKINALQASLQQQEQQLDIVIGTEQEQNSKLHDAQSQQQSLLNYNQQQQNSYNSQIAANQQQIATLRAEQIAANEKLVGSGVVDASGSCGGTYPATASGAYGPWGCDYPHSSDDSPGCSYLDSWGMCNRECVSYTAWMVYENYGIDTTGYGNANQWPASAAAAGVPEGSTPKVGAVAIYMGGAYGHAMWVKSVNGDGTITVDQYNLYYDGNFYETTISSAGLTYLYFGG